MKLHLPKMLRQAVMACMTAITGFSTTVATGAVFGGAALISFAAQQAVAETYTISTNADTHLTSAVAGDLIILDLTGWFEAAANGTKIINADVQINKAEINNGSAGCNYFFKGTITGSGDFSFMDGGSDNQTYIFAGDMSAYTGNMSIHQNKKGYFTFREKTGTGTVTAMNTNSVVEIDTAIVNNSSISAANITLKGVSTFKSGMTLVATNGISNNAANTFDNITLGGTFINSDGGSVTLTGTTTLLDSLAKSVASTTNGFASSEYTLVNDGSTLTLGAGAKLVLENGTDVTALLADGKVAGASGTIYNIVEANSTIESSNITGESGFVITGAGSTLVLNDITEMSELADGVVVNVGNGNSATVGIGTLLMADATSITRQSGTLNVEVLENGVLVLSENTGSPRVNGDITIKAGGRVNSTTGDTLGYNAGATKNVYMQGTADSYAQFDLLSRVTMTTNIILGGYTKINNAGSTAIDITGNPAGFDTFGGSITATGIDNTIGICISERNALTVDVTGAGDALEISGLVYNSKAADGSRGITKTGAGTLTFSYTGDLHENTFTGVLAVNEGKVVLASDATLKQGASVANGATLQADKDATLTLGAAIKVAAGGTFDGKGATLAVDSLNSLTMVGDATQYVDINGAASENGYRSGNFTVIEGTDGADIKGVSSIIVAGEQKELTFDETTGSAYVADTDFSKYYVNTTVNYDADTMGGINAYSVSSGGTLNTTLADMLGKVTLEDDTAKLYLTNTDGDALLQFTGNQGGTGLILNVAEEKDANGLWVVTSSTPTTANYTGNIIVLTGTKLQAESGGAFGPIYLNNTNRYITVQDGAVLDVNGVETYYHVVLKKGATLANTGAAVNTDEKRQIPVLTLQGDANVVADGWFGMVGSGHGVATLQLNGHTLTKSGSADFTFGNTTADAGTIYAKEGRVILKRGGNFNGTVLKVAEGAIIRAESNANYSGAIIELEDGGEFQYRTGADNSFAALNTGASTLSAADGAARIMTVTGSSVSTGLLTKTNNGALTYSGKVELQKGMTVEAGTVNLNGQTVISGLLTVKDGAKLTVGGTGQVSIGNLAGLSSTPIELPTVNGLVSSNGTYKILDKGASATVTGLDSVTYLGKAYTLDETGSVAIGSSIYYVVEENSVVTLGGTTPTEGTATADGYYVGSGATLSIAGAPSDTMTAVQAVLATSGNGKMVLNSDVWLNENTSVVFEGNMVVNSGATLTLGKSDGGNQNTYAVDVSRLSSLDLNGGTLQMHYVAPEIQAMNVTAASAIKVDDLKSGGPATVINSLNLDAALTVETTWKSNINIGVLTGSGDMTIKQIKSDESIMSPLVIGGVDKYSGKITISGDGHHKVALSLNIGDEQTFSSAQLTVAGSNATATISGTGVYDLGNTLSLGERVSLADSWAGTVKVAGVSVADAEVLAPTGLTNANSTLEVAGLTVAKGGQLTLGGNVKLSGEVVLGDAITSSAMATTFGTDLTLYITGLESEVTEDGKHVFTLFTGDAVNLSNLTAANLSAATKGMAASDADWSFGTDGTITLASLVQYRNTSGAWADDNWTGKDGSNGSELKASSSVVFNATGTDTVTINAAVGEEVKVLDMSVESGKYDFGGVYGAAASLQVADTLSTAAGSESTFNMGVTTETLDNAGKITSNNMFSVTGDASVTDGSITATRYGMSVGGDYTQSGGSVTTAALAVGGDYTQTAGDMRAATLEVTGATTISGGSIGSAGTDALVLSGATIGNTTVDNVELTDSTIVGQLTNNSTLTLNGAIEVDDINFTPTDAISSDNRFFTGSSTTASNSGFMVGAAVIQLVTGTGTITEGEDLEWSCTSNDDTIINFDSATGVLTRTDNSVGSVFYINSGDTISYSNTDADFINSKNQAATGLMLNGGNLVLETELADTVSSGIVVAQDGTVGVNAGVVLNKGQLSVLDAASATLEGEGTYALGASTQLGTGVSLGDAWTGTVQLDDQLLGNGTLELTDALFNQQGASTVQAGAITAGAMNVGGNGDDTFQATSIQLQGTSSITAGTTQVGGSVELLSGASLALGGDLSATALNIASGATLTGADSKVTLGGRTRNGATSVIAGTLAGTGTLANTAGHSMKLDNMAAAEGWKLENAGALAIDITTSNNLTLGALSMEAGSTTELIFNSDNAMTGLLTLNTLALNGGSLTLESTGTGLLETGEYVLGTVAEGVTGNGKLTTLLNGVAFSRLDSTLSQVYVDASGNIILNAVKSSTNELAKVANSTNAKAGATLLWDAETPAGSLMESIYNSVGTMIEKGNVAAANETMAAVAGSSTATLGMAFAGDVDRQLRAIRNRTTTMGVNQTIVNEGLPYVNAWVNAEGNHAEMDADGTAAGYSMDNWGGTIGFDVDVTTNLTVGVALTAMYGDITADGPDMAEGSLDTLYFSAFARYAERATTHTFVATIGHMTGDLERTVNYGTGSYTSKGDTDGLALGLMYEYGKVYKLNESGDACWQPILNVAWRSVLVNGYDESGSDASLKVDDQAMHTFTIGAGARMQAIVGENLYNRTSILELRALAKVDIGDTKSEVDVALLKGGKSAGIESAELGMFGVELGAGLSVPVGDDDGGSLFFDVSAEIRDGYTNFNGTVGYRINF